MATVCRGGLIEEMGQSRRRTRWVVRARGRYQARSKWHQRLEADTLAAAE